MAIDEELVAAKIRYWRKYLDNYQLPTWENIPNMGLYMEQVLTLLDQYLDYLPPELKDEEFVTAATINNYVRKGIMPKPEKKRYYRIHLAYLIMICTWKQSLAISTLGALLPADLTEAQVRNLYESFRQRQISAARAFTHHASIVAANLLKHNDGTEVTVDTPEEFAMFAAAVGMYSSLLAEKLLLLDGKTLASAKDGHQLSDEEYRREFDN